MFPLSYIMYILLSQQALAMPQLQAIYRRVFSHCLQSAPQCDLCVALWLSCVIKRVTHSFPSSDAGTRNTVCLCWADVFMLLATLVRRDSSAAYPSVSAALGKRWRTFAGTPIRCSVCTGACVSKSDKMCVIIHFRLLMQ